MSAFSNDSLTCHPSDPVRKRRAAPATSEGMFRCQMWEPRRKPSPKPRSLVSVDIVPGGETGIRFPRLSFSFETHGDKEIFSGVAGRKSTAFELSSSISNTYLLIGVDGRVSHSLAVRSLVLSSSRCTSPSLSQTVPLASRSTYHVSTSHSMLSPCFCQTLSSNSLPLGSATRYRPSTRFDRVGFFSFT